MRLLVLPALSLALMAAAPPQRALVMAVPIAPGLGEYQAPARPKAPSPSSFQPAPLPNRDLEGPGGERAGNGTSLSPSLVQRSDSYRGEGFSRGSTAQTEQERHVRPGAGFNLRVPFAPN